MTDELAESLGGGGATPSPTASLEGSGITVLAGTTAAGPELRLQWTTGVLRGLEVGLKSDAVVRGPIQIRLRTAALPPALAANVEERLKRAMGRGRHGPTSFQWHSDAEGT
jgi:hypothetical protein